MIRLGAMAAGLVMLAACGQAGPAVATEPRPTNPTPPTSTPFLPRGFANLPESSPRASPPPANPAPGPAEAIDLSPAVDRLNQLRAQEAIPGLARSLTLDRIAQERADALAETRSVWHVPPGGQGAVAEGALRSAGFGGRVGEIAMSIDLSRADPLGAVLQAMLTDSANRALAFDPLFSAGALGSSERDDVAYVVVLLTQGSPDG